MPPTNKRAALRDATPTVRNAIRHLKKTGEPDMAAAVTTLLDFALESAASRDRAATREAGLDRNRPVSIPEELRDHFNHAKGDAVYGDIVTDGMRRFLAGTWMPRKEQFDAGTWEPPVRGYGRKAPAGPRKTLNLRIPSEVWTAAEALGQDPEAAAERGYKLSAGQIAIAALEERFGAPAPQGSTTA